MTQMTQMTQDFHSSARGRRFGASCHSAFWAGRPTCTNPLSPPAAAPFTTTVEGFSRVFRRRGELSYLDCNRLWYKSSARSAYLPCRITPVKRRTLRASHAISVQVVAGSLPFCAALVQPAVSRAQGAGGGKAAPVFPFPIPQTVLDNGLTVIPVRFDSPGLVAYYTVVRTGCRNEVEAAIGIRPLLRAHDVPRHDALPLDAYNDALKPLGADSNAFTNADLTTTT